MTAATVVAMRRRRQSIEDHLPQGETRSPGTLTLGQVLD
jgi:hypothetical protein